MSHVACQQHHIEEWLRAKRQNSCANLTDPATDIR
jgi:hypothetical protein